MKKTITTIAVTFGLVASAATAADELTSTQIYINNTTDTTLSSGNNALTWDTSVVSSPLSSYMFTFSVAPTATKTGNLFSASMGNYSTPVGLGARLAYTSGGNNNVLHISSGAGNSTTTGLSFTSGQVYTFAYNATTATAYIVATNGTTEDVQYISCEVTDSSLTTSLTSGTFRGFANGTATPVTFGAVTDLSSIASDSAAFSKAIGIPGSDNIPEPATATLSLLALAGLAARRRRK